MCGIAVHFNSLGRATPLDLELIHHRGPDSRGEWISPDGRCWLGNTRLAIVDLSPTGDQPMTDPATRNVIVTNGEIYNHRAVREKLGRNVDWRGTSDTETLLMGYARWGHAVLEHLKGMFAFAIYDAARDELFLARDRLGIKPLYYTADANGVRAGSEVRLLAPASATIKPEAVSAYLQWGACPEGELIYANIQALPAGHAMTIGPDGEIKTWRYWPSRKTFALFPDNVVGRVRALIDKAVEEHLLSDVPVASFLSGGIDSSVVTALAAQKLANKLQTYSVGFDLAEFDETAIAQEIAERYRTDHHRIQLSEEEVIHSVTEAVEKLDLPSVDAINTYIVSRAVAAHGVKVALSGLGGDELFGGYPSFRDVPRLQLIATLPRFLRKVIGLAGNLGDRLADLPATGDAGELARWRRRFLTDDMIRRAGLPIATEAFEYPVALPDDFARISWAEADRLHASHVVAGRGPNEHGRLARNAGAVSRPRAGRICSRAAGRGEEALSRRERSARGSVPRSPSAFGLRTSEGRFRFADETLDGRPAGRICGGRAAGNDRAPDVARGFRGRNARKFSARASALDAFVEHRRARALCEAPWAFPRRHHLAGGGVIFSLGEPTCERSERSHPLVCLEAWIRRAQCCVARRIAVLGHAEVCVRSVSAPDPRCRRE